MKKLYFLLLLCFWNSYFAQTSSFFGNIPDLVFRKEIVKTPIDSDTLKGHVMNFHFVKDTLKSPFLYNTHSKLQGLSVFFVSNKLGGENRTTFGKVGSAAITSNGVFDFGDSLIIDCPIESPKIITYSKKDQSKNQFIFLSPIQDKSILIPDFLVFNRDLASNEKQRIETFLSIKYGISVNYISEKNYFSADGDVIWNFKDNKKYGYRVTGIGRDDAFGLYQKQSSNIEKDVVTFSLGDLKTLNQDNSQSLNDKEFLLWGDNNAEIIFPVEDLLASNAKGNMLRKWKMQSKSTNPLKSNIYFNLKNIEANNTPKLKIFRTSENFQNDIAELFSGEKLNDSTFVYKDIYWDQDRDGTDYFTLNNSENPSNISIISSCSELQNGLIKINIPSEILGTSYSLLDLKDGTYIENHQPFFSNQISFTNLSPSQYQLRIHRSNSQPDIVRTFDMEGISNQNIKDYYLWKGEPIELDINYENYQYTLIKPNGTTTNYPPFLLDGLGDFTLEVKNKLGCEIQKQLRVLNQTDYANQNDNSIFKLIKLYPNPTRDGNFSIKVELKEPKSITIQIYNSLGVLLKQANYNNKQNVLSTFSIPPVVGYYNVKIFIPEESKGYNLLIN